MIIRKANKKDAGEIAKHAQKYFGKDYKPFRFTKEVIEGKVLDKAKTFFVAVENKKIIGLTRLDGEDIDLADFRWWSSPDREFEKKLVFHSLEFLRKQKFRKVFVKIKSNDKRSLKLFKSFGFKQEGYFKNHYRNGTDIVQLSKFLR